jgi:CRP-like cAMP-binding protein
MQDLFKHLSSFGPLSDPCKNFIADHIVVKEIPKKKHLLRIGGISKHIYFINKGLFRGYCYQNGNRKNIWFMAENDIMFGVGSFYTQQPSHEGIQALEDSKVYSLSRMHLDRLYEKHPEFNLIGRRITEKYYLKTLPDNERLRFFKGNERVSHLRDESPWIFHRVPVIHLASYLGLSLSAFYRGLHRRS